MNDEKDLSTSKCEKNRGLACGGSSNAVYGLGFVGAVIYYLQQATTLWAGIVGVFKAITWPAFVVYKLLEYLKM